MGCGASSAGPAAVAGAKMSQGGSGKVVRKFDQYYQRIGRPIGEGGFGKVFQCKLRTSNSPGTGGDDVTKRLYAVKEMQKKENTTWQKECDLLKTIDHPNIAKLYDVFEDRRNIYLVMEFCEGQELFDYIVSEEPREAFHVATVMEMIMRGVYHLHQKGIVHRDLKLENFMLKYVKKTKTMGLKVIDFGLAKCITQEGNDECLSTVLGTKLYTAPEVMDNGRKYGRPADIWSCGVVLYVMVMGRETHPYPWNDDEGNMLRQKGFKSSHKWLPPFAGKGSTHNNIEVWKPARELITKMCDPNPNKRPTALDALKSVQDWKQFLSDNKLKSGLKTESLDSKVTGNELITNLAIFKNASRFEQIAMYKVAEHANDGEIKELRKHFLAMDVDQDGTLTHQEIRDALVKTCKRLDETELMAMLKVVDMDGVTMNKIDYTEWLAATLDRRKELQDDQLWYAFRQFDKNNDGAIDRGELASVLEACRKGHDEAGLFGDDKAALEQHVNDVMTMFDADGNDRIDFEEFKAAMRMNQATQDRVDDMIKSDTAHFGKHAGAPHEKHAVQRASEAHPEEKE